MWNILAFSLQAKVPALASIFPVSFFTLFYVVYLLHFQDVWKNHTDITETPTISNYKFLVLSLRCFYLFFSGVYLKLSLRELIECVEKPEQRHRINMDALAYIRKKGVTVDRFYPGMKKKEGCRRVDMNPTRSIRDYHLLVPNDEENLKIAVATIGPISVSIRVTGNFFFYKTGIFYDKECGSATQE